MILRLTAVLLLVANMGIWAWLAQAKPPPPLPVVKPVTEQPATDPGVPGIEMIGVDSGDIRQCFTFGPLRTSLEQQRAIERIRSFAATVWMRQTRATVERGWWVFLPPVASRVEALDQAESIASAGIDDYFVVTSGDMENTVSLGLYSDEDNARRRQAEIQAQGFNAEIGLRREPEPRYWVDYRLNLQRRDLGRILLRAFPEAMRIRTPCPGNDQDT